MTLGRAYVTRGAQGKSTLQWFLPFFHRLLLGGLYANRDATPKIWHWILINQRTHSSHLLVDAQLNFSQASALEFSLLSLFLRKIYLLYRSNDILGNLFTM